MIDRVDEQNFLLFAAKHYDNPSCSDTTEFTDDLKRFMYLKRLLNKYKETGELKERLILNHLIVIYNVFGIKAATKMLFFRLRGYYHILKPFLVFLGYMPERVEGIGIKEDSVYSSDIEMETGIVDILRGVGREG